MNTVRQLFRFITTKVLNYEIEMSYEHVETNYWDMGDHLIVNQSFRGKNAFGGTIKNTIKAKVSIEGEVIEVIEQY